MTPLAVTPQGGPGGRAEDDGCWAVPIREPIREAEANR